MPQTKDSTSPAPFKQNISTAGTSMATAPINAEAIQQWLISRFAEVLEIATEEISTRKPMTKYGLGSIQAIAIVGDLEEFFGRALPPTLLWDFETLEDVSLFMVSNAL
jgi:acyl carrier protein